MSRVELGDDCPLRRYTKRSHAVFCPEDPLDFRIKYHSPCHASSVSTKPSTLQPLTKAVDIFSLAIIFYEMISRTRAICDSECRLTYSDHLVPPGVKFNPEWPIGFAQVGGILRHCFDMTVVCLQRSENTANAVIRHRREETLANNHILNKTLSSGCHKLLEGFL